MARILVVDDEPELRRYLRMLLEEAGYEVVESQDGKEALKTACSLVGIDLLITDLVMPRNEGIELIQQLRELMEHLKVIAISGMGHGQYLQMARLLGADAVFAKPFDAEELLAVVRTLLTPKS